MQHFPTASFPLSWCSNTDQKFQLCTTTPWYIITCYTTTVFFLVQYIAVTDNKSFPLGPTGIFAQLFLWIGATSRSKLMWLAFFNYINYHAFEKTASEHWCNIVLKSRGECNKGLVSLLSKKHPTLPSTGQGSYRNAMGSFNEILWLFKLGTSSAPPGLHLLCPSLAHGTARTGWCAPPWTGNSWNEGHKPEGWGCAHCVQVTVPRRPKEAIAATSVLREAMRHPKLHFQNLLSPAAFGGLWEHSIGLSSCLWSLVSFCVYSQVKWVSRPKGFKLIPPN